MDWVQLIKNEGYQEFAPEVKGEAGEGQGKSNDGRRKLSQSRDSKARANRGTERRTAEV